MPIVDPEPLQRLIGAALQAVGAGAEQAATVARHMVGANLEGAKLRNANLKSANLCEAFLSGADLRDANLDNADLEGANINLVGGDIYSGSCALDQNLVWRPLPSLPGHRTPIVALYHVGASTHPGPGLGAGSGYLVAKQLTRAPLARRVLAKVPGLA